uniref:diacylglycerol O-acyltransferase n=1 Tax=Lygus hesperus TaxID=30085 RepID=A0A0A9XKG3_LYGHE
MHPHGYLGFSHLYNILLNPPALLNLPLRFITIPINFCIPVWRDLVLSYGVISASYKSCEYALQHRTSVGIVVGGAAESLYAGTNNATLVLKHRYGFIKLALQTGSDIIPVYSFGENRMYRRWFFDNPFLRRVQSYILRTFGFTLPLVHGSFSSLLLLPYRQPIVTVVGVPIQVHQNSHPQAHDIEKLHALYCQRLTDLYYKYATVLYRTDPPPLLLTSSRHLM